MGYLIGEKLLNFLEVAERNPTWRAEVPHFIARIKAIFEPWQIAEFFETPRRLGALGHASDEEGHKLLRSQMDESEKVREDARNLMLFESARELLMERKRRKQWTTDHTPPDTPGLHALEGNLFGAIFGFHKKVMTLLRGAGLADDKLGVASERIGHLLRETTEGIKSTKDLNIQPRLDAMYEDVQRMVDELVALGSLRDQMEQIYSETPPADIPWNIETPPKALVELIDSGQIQPCKAIDLGCGAGNYAIYLASLGFDVTGVDISPSAIALAEANAKQKGVTCRFRGCRRSRRPAGNHRDVRVRLRLVAAAPRLSPRQETVRRDRASVAGSGWEVPVGLLQREGRRIWRHGADKADAARHHAVLLVRGRTARPLRT